MKFLVGRTHEVFDEEGVLEVRMYYPHSRQRVANQSMIEVTQAGANHIRVAGLMHEPADEAPVVMAGMMGMVHPDAVRGVREDAGAPRRFAGEVLRARVPGKTIV